MVFEVQRSEFGARVHNSVLSGRGFYVSFNDGDVASYGCETTALVVGQMEAFYVLCGDHREAFARLVTAGLEACKSYVRENKAVMHRFSDQLA